MREIVQMIPWRSDSIEADENVWTIGDSYYNWQKFRLILNRNSFDVCIEPLIIIRLLKLIMPHIDGCQSR